MISRKPRRTKIASDSLRMLRDVNLQEEPRKMENSMASRFITNDSIFCRDFALFLTIFSIKQCKEQWNYTILQLGRLEKSHAMQLHPISGYTNTSTFILHAFGFTATTLPSSAFPSTTRPFAWCSSSALKTLLTSISSIVPLKNLCTV